MNKKEIGIKRVLVTGATGFVGRHLTHHFLHRSDVTVRIMARSIGKVGEVFGDKKDLLEVSIADITDRKSLKGVCDGVDTLFHCVALTGPSLSMASSASDTHNVNARGTVWLAEEALQARVSRFLFVSSTAAAGLPASPVMDETAECLPVSPYQVSKRTAEKELLKLHRESGLGVVIVRPCLVTGEGIEGGELLDLFKLCKRGFFPVFGRSLDVEKPLIHVNDLIQGLVLASTRGRPGEIYLVHSGSHHTLAQIMEVAGNLVGNSRPYRIIPLPVARAAAGVCTFLAQIAGRLSPLTQERIDLFIANRSVDISKARRELGYSPRFHDLRFMLEQTYNHYLRTGQL